MSAPTTDTVAETLAAYERLAIETGATVRIDPPEFSDDGDTWRTVWARRDGHDHPLFVRATVHRDATPTTIYLSWDEQIPPDDAWRSLWHAKPMALFGARGIRAALRRAYRDAIGDRHEPDEIDPADVPTAPKPQAAPPAPVRDIIAELTAAETVGALTRIWAEARPLRLRTGAAEVVYNERRAALLAGEGLDTVPADEPAVPEVPARPAPQDHLPPRNRAARRASKKGKRR